MLLNRTRRRGSAGLPRTLHRHTDLSIKTWRLSLDTGRVDILVDPSLQALQVQAQGRIIDRDSEEKIENTAAPQRSVSRTVDTL